MGSMSLRTGGCVRHGCRFAWPHPSCGTRGEHARLRPGCMTSHTPQERSAAHTSGHGRASSRAYESWLPDVCASRARLSVWCVRGGEQHSHDRDHGDMLRTAHARGCSGYVCGIPLGSRLTGLPGPTNVVRRVLIAVELQATGRTDMGAHRQAFGHPLHTAAPICVRPAVPYSCILPDRRQTDTEE
jgi:hypothetical protein